MDFSQPPPTEIFGIATPVLFFGTWAVGVCLATWVMYRYYKARTRSNLRDDLHQGPRREIGGPRRR